MHLDVLHPLTAHFSEQPTTTHKPTTTQTTHHTTTSGADGGTTIHQGSCVFGQLSEGAGTGYDIAALSDSDPEFSGSCGRCYEGACVRPVYVV